MSKISGDVSVHCSNALFCQCSKIFVFMIGCFAYLYICNLHICNLFVENLRRPHNKTSRPHKGQLQSGADLGFFRGGGGRIFKNFSKILTFFLVDQTDFPRSSKALKGPCFANF